MNTLTIGMPTKCSINATTILSLFGSINNIKGYKICQLHLVAVRLRGDGYNKKYVICLNEMKVQDFGIFNS